jgi:hypothetical protein
MCAMCCVTVHDAFHGLAGTSYVVLLCLLATAVVDGSPYLTGS